MTRVLVTGGSGFVGRQVVRALLGASHDITLVLRPGGLARSGFASAAIRVIETPDLFAEDVGWWQRHLEGINTVIHAAWYVEPGLYLDSPRNVDCLRGSLALADGAVAAGVSHFIGVGTCFEYRLPNDHITIEAPLGPVTLYAAAKLALYLALGRRFADAGIGFSWARLFYLFGEGEHPARLYPTLHRKLAAGEAVALSSPGKRRDFLDVAEAGAMIAALVDTRQHGAINICSGRAITIGAIAETIADRYGRRDLLEFGTAAVHPRDPEAVVGVPNLVPSAQ